MVQITKDNAYDAVAPDDFPAMLEIERYGHRNTAFDKIISATHDHFWDPLDKKYIDFAEPFDLATKTIMPLGFFPIFATRIADALRPDSPAGVARLREAAHAAGAPEDVRVCVLMPHVRRSCRRSVPRQNDSPPCQSGTKAVRLTMCH